MHSPDDRWRASFERWERDAEPISVVLERVFAGPRPKRDSWSPLASASQEESARETRTEESHGP